MKLYFCPAESAFFSLELLLPLKGKPACTGAKKECDAFKTKSVFLTKSDTGNSCGDLQRAKSQHQE